MKIIFNTCGINGSKYEQYITNMKSIPLPEGADLVISGCNHENDILDLSKKLNLFSIINYWDIHPVNVTFNKTVMTIPEDQEGYIYIDSGVNCLGFDIVSKIRDFVSKNPDAGMVSFKVDTDMGYQEWDIHHTNDDIAIPVGKAVNLHVQWFSYDLFKFFGKLIPDIFASHCTESTFTFICASLNKKWYLLGEPVLAHEVSLDGMSAGFSPHKWVAESGRPTYDHPYKIPSVLSRICTAESYSLGFGYEEMRGVFCHNTDMYDENGYAKSKLLKYWISENLFLSKKEFDYGMGSIESRKPLKCFR